MTVCISLIIKIEPHTYNSFFPHKPDMSLWGWVTSVSGPLIISILSCSSSDWTNNPFPIQIGEKMGLDFIWTVITTAGRRNYATVLRFTSNYVMWLVSLYVCFRFLICSQSLGRMSLLPTARQCGVSYLACGYDCGTWTLRKLRIDSATFWMKADCSTSRQSHTNITPQSSVCFRHWLPLWIRHGIPDKVHYAWW